MEEIWKPIESVDGEFEISNFGRIRRPAKIFSLGIGRNGYYLTSVRIQKVKTNKKKNLYAHREVALAFLEQTNKEKWQVNHIDGNKLNNNLSNLEWSTPSDNTKHALKIGLLVPLRGESNGASKLKKETVLEIRRLSSEGLKNEEIAKIFNISRSHVSGIVRRLYWTDI